MSWMKSFWLNICAWKGVLWGEGKAATLMNTNCPIVIVIWVVSQVVNLNNAFLSPFLAFSRGIMTLDGIFCR